MISSTLLFGALIIISAGVIFYILVRRLPDIRESQAPEGDFLGKPVETLPENPDSKFVLPKLKQLPKLPKFSYKVPKVSLPKLPVRTKKESNAKPQPISLQEADIYMQRGDLRSAEDMYIKLIAENPSQSKIYSRLGAIYLQQRNFADARDAFLAAIKIDSSVPSRHYNLALAYEGLKSFEKAKVSIAKAIALDSNNQKYQQFLEKLQ